MKSFVFLTLLVALVVGCRGRVLTHENRKALQPIAGAYRAGHPDSGIVLELKPTGFYVATCQGCLFYGRARGTWRASGNLVSLYPYSETKGMVPFRHFTASPLDSVLKPLPSDSETIPDSVIAMYPQFEKVKATK